jgi:hypothetical protein
MTTSPVVKVANIEDISPANVGGKHVLVCTDLSTDAYMILCLGKERTSLTNTVLT